jgi:hypothetical protein
MKKYTIQALFGAMLIILSAPGCDNGPVGKALNCAQICDKYHACFTSVDESKCRESCREDASKSEVASCSDCLDSDSCGQCATSCAGVGIDVLFSR